MITAVGRDHIKRYLAGYAPALANQISIGIGDKVESVNDFLLEFEVGREDISAVSMDPQTNIIYFKAPLPLDFEGTVREVGLVALSADSAAGSDTTSVVSAFDSDTETWVESDTDIDADFTEDNVLAGLDGLLHQPVPSGTYATSLNEAAVDLSEASGSDIIRLAIYSANTNTTNVALRFMTDAGNYYEFDFTPTGTGHQFLSATKNSASVVGSPDWEAINELRVITTANSGGSGYVVFDGINVDPATPLNSGLILIARNVLTTPFVKEAGREADVEYQLEVNL